MMRRSKRKAFRLYMRDEIGVVELSDAERDYIRRRLGRKLRLFQRFYVWFYGKIEKLLHIVKIDRIIVEAQEQERGRDRDGGLSA